MDEAKQREAISDFTNFVVTETVYRLTCFDGTSTRCEGVIEEGSPEACSVRANADKWHLADDGGVYCESCWEKIEEEQKIEDAACIEEDTDG